MGTIKGVLDVAATTAVLGAAIVVGHAFLWRSHDDQKGRAAQQIQPTEISLGTAPFYGDDTATVGIVIFADFHCPFCRTLATTVLPVIRERYITAGKAKLAFKHFPLEAIHPHARRAGELAACAGNQGRFWAAHDFLFKPATASAVLGEQEFAAAVGANVEQLRSCLKNNGTKVVDIDVSEGRSVGVSGTPATFIGRLAGDVVTATWKVTGSRSASVFETIIAELLTAER